jgi:hypothetical protein
MALSPLFGYTTFLRALGSEEPQLEVRRLGPDRIKGLPVSSEMHVHPPPPRHRSSLLDSIWARNQKLEQGPGFETGWLWEQPGRDVPATYQV